MTDHMLDGVIITYTGKLFKPLEPDSALIDPIDVAHALGNQCRYTGHTQFFYSVATHSVLLHDYAEKEGYDEEICKWLLLHDAEEAYLLDLAAPIKKHASGFGKAFCEAADRISEAVAVRFELPLPVPPIVKELDERIRENEFEELFPGFDREPKMKRLPVNIPMWSPAVSKHKMISRLRQYRIVGQEYPYVEELLHAR